MKSGSMWRAVWFDDNWNTKSEKASTYPQQKVEEEYCILDTREATAESHRWSGIIDVQCGHRQLGQTEKETSPNTIRSPHRSRFCLLLILHRQSLLWQFCTKNKQHTVESVQFCLSLMIILHRHSYNSSAPAKKNPNTSKWVRTVLSLIVIPAPPSQFITLLHRLL